jgi:2',3'-cyclic-nucleotide 2'-phosphodiesterase (5'-nucleotidase family)
MRFRLMRGAGLIAVVLTMVLSPLGAAAAAPRPTVAIQLLSISDWHGQLDPLVVGTTQIGGAAALSAYFQADRLANPNTLTFTAGDSVGATPPISNFFGDRPAIEAENLMGLSIDTFGNHNFDHGIAHLQELIDLADFPYVSANLKDVDANLTGVEPFHIFTVAGVKVAVIGITNPEAPLLVFPGSFGTIELTDPVKAANKARSQAAQAGAKVFIAITHMGIEGFDPATGLAYGPLINFANAIGGFNVVLGDHTDFQYSGVHNNALVVENKSKGLTYARTQLTVDPSNGRVLTSSAQFVTPFVAAVTPDPVIAAMINAYRVQLAPFMEVAVGTADKFIPRADACGNSAGRTCESLVGNVTTDALRLTYATDFAITNSGGLRSSLTCPLVDLSSDFCPAYTPPPYPITRGQVNTVLPFGNVVVTVNINGTELKAMLERGVSAMPGVDGRFAQVSGLCFTYDIAAPVGSRVLSAVRQAGDGSCTGAAVDLTAASTYAVAENDFMASGGDTYPNFSGRAISRDIMDQVLADYITTHSPVSPSIQGRIVCTTSGATACPVVTP